MGLLTNIVAAADDEIGDVGRSVRPVDEWSGIERRDIDTAKIVMLHCLLTGDDLQESSGGYEPAFVADEGALVLRVADAMARRLALLDEEALQLVGEELAATEEFEADAWELDEVQALVTELADLARLAEAQDQALLVWMHPLPT